MGNNSADAVYTALSPTVATFGDRGRVVITTSVAAKTGIVYDLFDPTQAGQLDDFYITKTDTRSLNPKVSQSIIDNAVKRDPEAAQAEYFSEFREPSEAYLDAARIEESIDDRLKEATSRIADFSYCMSIDPATQRDRYAFCIMHKEKSVYILDYALALKPPVDPNAAEALLMELTRSFKPALIRCDTASTVQRLKGKIPQLEYTPFSRPFKLKIYGALKEALNLRHLVLYRQNELLDELKALQIRNGVDIAAPKSGRITHDDLADCLALCVDGLAGDAVSSLETIVNPLIMFDFIDPVDYHPKLDFFPKGKLNQKPHPEGVTWQNCPHRMTGCVACYEETLPEAEAEAELLKNTKPMSEAEYAEDMDRLRHPDRYINPAEQERRDNFRQTFWKHVMSQK